ncbi:MAG: DUF1592 domain-containing protein [Nannocystales bacterium]
MLLALSGCYSGYEADNAASGTTGASHDDADDDAPSGGEDGSDSSSDDDGPGEAAQCDPTVLPSPAPMRRLTRRQYENAIHDLAVPVVGESEAAAVLESLRASLSVVPEDNAPGFRRLDQTLAQAHIDGWYHVGRGLGAALTEDETRLEMLAGPCATDADPDNDAACVEGFVAAFGRRAFRRPLSEQEVNFYSADAAGSLLDVSAESFAERVSVLLMVPDFVYIIEDDNPEDGDGVFPLSGYELASRLAFHFWESIPDDALLDAAEDGRLETPEGYEDEVERMFAHDRTRRTLGQFTEQWLELEEVPAMDTLVGTVGFDAFVGEDTPSAQLRGAMVEEVTDVFRWFVYEQEGSLADFVTSNIGVVRDDELAALYGMSAWDGESAPGELPSDRGGLVTRAALVASGSAVTHPVLKGNRIRTQLLCGTIPAPPADIPPPPALDPLSTIREQLELLTEREGTSCLGCHALMNPLGYVTENYDGLGRLRTHEQIFDLSTGEKLGELPVDTQAVPRARGDDERVAYEGADLSQFIVESGLAEACLSIQYFRFAYGREEDPVTDACALESLQFALEDAGSLRSMLLDVAFQPEFQIRTRTEEN